MIIFIRVYLLVSLFAFAYEITSSQEIEKRSWFSFDKEKTNQAQKMEENRKKIVKILLEYFQVFILEYLSQKKLQSSPDQHENKHMHLNSLYIKWLESELKRNDKKHIWRF